MKKSLFILFVAFVGVMLTDCSSNDEPLKASQDAKKSESRIRTEAEAKEIAVALMENRSGARSSYSIEDVNIFMNTSSRAEADTLIYAINFTDNKGFVLVSAAKNGEEIIGYADHGRIDADEIIPTSGFTFYMDAAKNYVEGQLSLPVDTTIEPFKPQPKPVTTYEKVAPRVHVEWGQYDPEGCLYENHVCGCVQTACLQILSAFKQPTNIIYSYPNHAVNSETIDWDNICKHIKSDHYDYDTGYSNSNCEASPEAHFQISRIAREIGYRNDAVEKYDPVRTSAFGEDAVVTMRALLPMNINVSQFSDFGKSYDSYFLLLKNKKAVFFMGGVDLMVGGHAWVCSGGERITTTIHNDFSLHGDVKEVKIFFHFNWGFEGSYNGYFTAGVFDISKSTTPSRANFGNYVKYFSVY